MSIRINGTRLEFVVVALGMALVIFSIPDKNWWGVGIGAFIMFVGIRWYLSSKGYIKSFLFHE